MACNNPILLEDRGLVPCGKCLPCLVRRQQDWTFRLQKERDVSSACHFITLTYDDSTVPRETMDNGRDINVLRKKDLQLWIKRLRKHIHPARVRYFACGEYGSKTLRPHYHIILYNFPSSIDLKKVCDKTWTLGFNIVKDAHNNCFHYVAKYCTMKMDLPKFLLRRSVRPFSLCSTKPALGSAYLTDAMIRYHRSTLSTFVMYSGIKYSMPKYFKDKIFDDSMKADIRDRATEFINSIYLDREQLDYRKGRDLQKRIDLRLLEQSDSDRRTRERLFKNRKI